LKSTISQVDQIELFSLYRLTPFVVSLNLTLQGSIAHFGHLVGSKKNKIGQMFIHVAEIKVSKKYILKTEMGESSLGQLVPRGGWGKGARCVVHLLSKKGRGRGCA